VAQEKAQKPESSPDSAENAEAPQAEAPQAEAAVPEVEAEPAVAETPAPAEPTGQGAPTGEPPTDPEKNDEKPSAAAEEVMDLPDFSDMLAAAAANSIDMLNDVELNVKIELGRAEMTVDDILKLTSGSVVELDKLAGDPVDILVNEQLIARGEVLVVNDNFCVRVNEIVRGLTEQIAQE